MPRFSSRRSPLRMTARLRYIAYAKGPHHRASTTTTASTARAVVGSAWIEKMAYPSGRNARDMKTKKAQHAPEILPTVTIVTSLYEHADRLAVPLRTQL